MVVVRLLRVVGLGPGLGVVTLGGLVINHGLRSKIESDGMELLPKGGGVTREMFHKLSLPLTKLQYQSNESSNPSIGITWRGSLSHFVNGLDVGVGVVGVWYDGGKFGIGLSMSMCSLIQVRFLTALHPWSV